MLKNMKVSIKLTMAFFSIILLLLVVAGVGYFGMSSAQDGFVTYRGLARDTNLSGRVQANMLEARLAVKNFIISRDKKDVTIYEARWKTMLNLMEEAKQEIQKPERAQKVSFIDQSLGQYQTAFYEVVDFMAERDKVVSTQLDPNGLRMRKLLTDLMTSAYQDQDSTAAYYAGRVQEHLLLGRLYMVKYLNTNNQADIDRAKKEFHEQMKEPLKILDQEVENPTQRKLLGEILASKKIYTDSIEEINTIITKRNKLINEVLDTVGPKVAGAVEEVKLSVKGEQDQLGPALQAKIRQSDIIIVVAVGVSLLLGIIISVLFSKAITSSLVKIKDAAVDISRGKLDIQIEAKSQDEFGDLARAFQEMTKMLSDKSKLSEQMAQGNLDVEVKLVSQEDVLGKSLQEMVGSLESTIRQVSVSADRVTSGAQQLAQSSISLSQGSTEQAASLEQISSSMEELSAQTRTNAENANQANQLATSARNQAEDGNAQMKTMLSSMQEINASSQNISNIIKTIDEIAFQTNVLAINAAVEAARAGTHGKGFAVVAEEVRNLAQRSAEAAKETTNLIGDSIKKVESGAKIADETAVALKEIVNGVTKVTDLVNEITTSSNEQARGMAEVNSGLTQLNQVVQKNAQMAEESSTGSDELSSQANMLKQVVERFKLRQQLSGSFNYHSPMPHLPVTTSPAFDPQPVTQAVAAQTDTSSVVSGKNLISFDEEDTGKF